MNNNYEDVYDSIDELYITFKISTIELRQLDMYYFESEVDDDSTRSEQIEWLKKEIDKL